MLKSYLHKAFSVFFILGFLFIPLTFFGWDFQYRLTRFIFLRLVTFIQNHLFKGAISTVDFSSDTIAFNILICLLVALALIIAILLYRFKSGTNIIERWFPSISAWYLALVLLKYGFDKVFKHQFYLPEPNILYSNFGSLNKDILYWSTMGLSRTYSVITGSAEVLTALLLMIKRTRIAGFCLAIVVLANIVLINFSFDISVKTFSLFLLAVALFNLLPYIKILYSFFIRRQQVQLPAVAQHKTILVKWISWLPCALIVLYVLIPYLEEGNFNDDRAARPLLHGAYNIRNFVIDGDTLKKDNFPYTRFFIHRKNYLILQEWDGAMLDYFFDADPINRQLTLRDYSKHTIKVNYNYTKTKGILKLMFVNKGKWIIEGDTLPIKTLPALQDGVHYTIDEIK